MNADIKLICNLKTIRQDRGLSQAHLAELTGVKRQAKNLSRVASRQACVNAAANAPG